MKIYSGQRTADRHVVTVDGKPLDPRYDLLTAASGSFEWGYDGTGPGQLALAILADFYGTDQQALAKHRQFLRAYVANIESDHWTLEGSRISEMLNGYIDVPMTLAELMDKVRGAP
jgi:hypothetical protein